MDRRDDDGGVVGRGHGDGDKKEQSSLQAKRASPGSTSIRSRPHSAAELFAPQNLGGPSAPRLRAGPQVVDVSQHGTVVEDEPAHGASSPRVNRTSRQQVGSTKGDGDERPRSSKKTPSRPLIGDKNAFKEDQPSPYENLTEISAPAPLRHEPEGYGAWHRDDGHQAPAPNVSRGTSRHRESWHGRRSSRGVSANSRTGRRSSSRRHHHDSTQLTELAAPGPTVSSPSPYRSRGLETSLEAGEEETWTPEAGEDKPPQKPSHVERTLSELFILSYLIFFSIFGTLARLGLQWLTFYPGAPAALGVLWANFTGSLLMGFFSEDRMLFREAHRTGGGASVGIFRRASRMDDGRFDAFNKMKKSIPLYVGLTTGLCGSMTSFSAFIRDVFLALSNDLPAPYNHASGTPQPLHAAGPPVPRNGGYSFMALVAVIILTVSVSLGGLQAGAHAALAMEHVPFPLHIFGSPRIRTALDFAMPVLALGCWLGAVFMAIWPPDRPGGPSGRDSWADESWRGEAIFACVFAPLGCLLRFYVSIFLNGLQPAFPLGTFVANMFGTAVLGMAWDLQHVPLASGVVGGGRVGCQVLQGIGEGFCGALTTVSTWVVELDGLRRRHAWVYGVMSVGVGLGLLVVIMGSVRWTVGWTAPACVM